MAWEAGDARAAAALYAPDCVFLSAPFREPEPPLAYTTRVFPEARAEDVRFGEPVAEASPATPPRRPWRLRRHGRSRLGERAAVEWWATLVLPGGEEQALAGCSILRFDDQGLVVEARDYWSLEPGRRAPHETWGR